MHADTLVALKESIRKWQSIVDGTGVDNGSGNCALCKRFCAEDCATLDGTEICPVVDAAGGVFRCNNTPYKRWNDYMFDRDLLYGDERCVTNDEERRMAQAELDFLISLLPVGLGMKPEVCDTCREVIPTGDYRFSIDRLTLAQPYGHVKRVYDSLQFCTETCLMRYMQYHVIGEPIND